MAEEARLTLGDLHDIADELEAPPPSPWHFWSGWFVAQSSTGGPYIGNRLYAPRWMVRTYAVLTHDAVEQFVTRPFSADLAGISIDFAQVDMLGIHQRARTACSIAERAAWRSIVYHLKPSFFL